jgi:nicotinamidase-related amidase
MTELPARSYLLMSPNNTALLVVDVQEKLVPAIQSHPRMVWNIGRLIDAAKLLGVKVLATEQYPKGLGATVAELRRRLDVAPEKTMFSCRECAGLLRPLRDQGIEQLIVVGIETHVCVQQTTLDLLSMGFGVYLAVDALGSRNDLDHQTALQRMQACGAMVTTTEAAMFEWCETSSHPQFKAISQLVRQVGPI